MGEGGEIGNHKGGWGINDPSRGEGEGVKLKRTMFRF